jgi:aspartate 1-decarboxylase
VFVDADNKIMGFGHDPAEALPGTGLLRGDLIHPVANPLAAGHTGSYDDDPVLAW